MSTRSVRAAGVVGANGFVEHRVEGIDAFDRAAATDAARVERHEVETVAQRTGQRSRDRGEEADRGRAGSPGIEHE